MSESPAAVATPAADQQLLWDVEQAAAALRISTRALKQAQAAGELPDGAVVRPFGGRRRLFSVEVLRAWVGQGCPPPPPPLAKGKAGRR